MSSIHLRYWLASVYLKGIGPRKILRWLEQFSDIEKLFLAPKQQWLAAGLHAKHIEALQHPDWKSVERDMAWAQETNQHLLVFSDPDYPPQLKEIADPPLVLYVKGNKAALKHLQVAMIGSRHPTPAGLQNAEQFAQHLAQAGVVVTSGLALGIDSASHQGALNARGITIAVAGTGLHYHYPAANRKLAERIMENNGAIISEFPLSVRPQPMNFPRRNRIISGLSAGVLVVEAALKSGSLITVKHALEQGRDVFAIPGSIHHPLARGCHHLIRQGAKLVEMANDILEELGGFPPPKLTAGSTAAVLPGDPKLRQILDQIGNEMTPIDVIISRSRLTPGEVCSILLKLELSGDVQSVTGGYIRVIPN